MVARLLDAAAELFLERGYDKTTTNHVAERAGVSIGSLYQFFPDKAAMLVALQAAWVAKLRSTMDTMLVGDAADLPLDKLIDRVLNVHVTLNREPPGLLGFLLTTPGAEDQLHSPTAQTLHGRVEQLVVARGIPMSAARRHIVTLMIGHIVRAIYHLGGPEGPANSLLLRETKAVLLAYLRTLER